jgi:hypothetical protein
MEKMADELAPASGNSMQYRPRAVRRWYTPKSSLASARQMLAISSASASPLDSLMATYRACLARNRLAVLTRRFVRTPRDGKRRRRRRKDRYSERASEDAAVSDMLAGRQPPKHFIIAHAEALPCKRRHF